MVLDFIGVGAWLEVEGAQGGGLGFLLEELRVEVGVGDGAVTGGVADDEVRVASALLVSLAVGGDGAAE